MGTKQIKRSIDKLGKPLIFFILMGVIFFSTTSVIIFDVNASINSPALSAPGDIPKPDKTLQDVDAKFKASEFRILSGDNFANNLYERPFTARDMVYQPDINILNVTIASDRNFIFFTIELEGVNPQTRALKGNYGIEFDRTKTGRGDLLVWVEEPQRNWSMENVTVFTDPDHSVGGPTPMRGDEKYDKLGYEKEEVLGGQRVAFARIAPLTINQIQIAVSRALLDNASEFLWGAWADKGIRNPLLFDYNDHFGLSASGSPLKESADYPVKIIYNLDNTCRMPYGFSTVETIRGMCSGSIQCKLVTQCLRKYVCIKKQICS